MPYIKFYDVNVEQHAKCRFKTKVQLGPQGRLVIPAQLRRMLGFEPGNALVIRMEDDPLILEKPEAIRRRLKARFAKLAKGASLVDQLLAERRKEAKKEGSI